MQRCRRNLSIKAEQEKNGNLKLNQESSKVSVHEEKNQDEQFCSLKSMVSVRRRSFTNKYKNKGFPCNNQPTWALDVVKIVIFRFSVGFLELKYCIGNLRIIFSLLLT